MKILKITKFDNKLWFISDEHTTANIRQALLGGLGIETSEPVDFLERSEEPEIFDAIEEFLDEEGR